jgi:3'(2'), 5'-bisphosphate nucleotidase
LSKNDLSPVTITDFGAQALLISAIHYNFPEDNEESAEALRNGPALLESVRSFVSFTELDDDESEKLLSPLASQEEMLDVIDLGAGCNAGRGRVWVLIPLTARQLFFAETNTLFV